MNCVVCNGVHTLDATYAMTTPTSLIVSLQNGNVVFWPACAKHASALLQAANAQGYSYQATIGNSGAKITGI